MKLILASSIISQPQNNVKVNAEDCFRAHRSRFWTACKTWGFLKFWSQNFRNPEVLISKTSGILKFWIKNFRIWIFLKTCHTTFWFPTKIWTFCKNKFTHQWSMHFCPTKLIRGSQVTLLHLCRSLFLDHVKLQDSWSFEIKTSGFLKFWDVKLQDYAEKNFYLAPEIFLRGATWK